MLTELRKHAATSRALRRIALEKDAGMLGAIGRAGWGAAKRVGGVVAAHPGKTAVGVMGGLAGIGEGRRTAALFKPAIHRAQMGISQ